MGRPYVYDGAVKGHDEITRGGVAGEAIRLVLSPTVSNVSLHSRCVCACVCVCARVILDGGSNISLHSRCVFSCMCVCVFVHVIVCVFMYVCMLLCVCLCVCV